ncbi:MAG: type II toxin-antitoxin system RelE/ParE family toxin [Anaerolineae bacterium]|nr:type II toxin-antitoxin system RelE/ParE family toxin [Anaerolineales bacterium]MCQ3974573.1 type II toxin-antitoxin system RelE/ParE family toxin [Anaerolineae bacterium]
MSYKPVLATSFKRSIKRLEKRFRNVKNDVSNAIKVLVENPKLGVAIPGGNRVRKLRVQNSDLARGKSGGYRLLYCIEDQPEPTLYLLLLYFKSDQEDVTQKELQDLLDELRSEMGL